MVPTLAGRLQTRVVALVTVGGLWTLLVTPWLPGADGVGAYRVTFVLLATVIVLGLAWDVVYHGLQQFRWEKDWPSIFGLLTAANEGLLVWVLLAAGAVPTEPAVSGAAFILHFGSTWLVTWAFLNGPVRAVLIRWRFRGGRLI